VIGLVIKKFTFLIFLNSNLKTNIYTDFLKTIRKGCALWCTVDCQIKHYRFAQYFSLFAILCRGNCLADEVKIVFSRGNRCYLQINRDNLVGLYFFFLHR